jgi:leader peptidase (prepilin peptidase)/N-methyltransferase
LVFDALAASPLLFIGTAVLLGLLVGSFLNVVIHRLPLMMEREEYRYCAELLGQAGTASAEPPPAFNLIVPRSRCPSCGHAISAAENIPLLSYVVQRGRCRACGVPISIQYPLIEALSGLLAGVCAWYFGFGWQAGAAMLLSWALIALSTIDFKTQLLPDSITLPFVWLGVGIALFGVFTDLRSSAIGAMAGYLSLWLVYQLFRLLTGKEGMGYGDFKLLALLGAWQGWQYLLAIVIVSSLVGSIVGLSLVLFRGRDHSIPMPFGPFLAAAGWITLLWGDDLIRWYSSWLGL